MPKTFRTSPISLWGMDCIPSQERSISDRTRLEISLALRTSTDPDFEIPLSSALPLRLWSVSM